MPLPTDTISNVQAVPACPRCGQPVPGAAGDCPRCTGKDGDSERIATQPTLLHVGQELPPRAMPLATVREPPDPLIGANLDVYRVDAFLGKGGMGRVYLAHHRDLHRPCALKILSPHLVEEDEDYVHRFLNEGRAAASLVHPNVVTIHACGQAEGLYFLEMEFVAGRSLRQLIHDEVRLSPLRATALTARVADGLAAAHRESIVHQDLKPDNVLMTLQGVPKLADFGLAKRIRAQHGEVPPALCGTPHFMAPELFQGEHTNPVSDVYALGVTYFLGLTGRYPFHADSLSGLVASVTSQPVPSVREFISTISLEVAECVARMLDKTPANRPQSAVEAAALLHAVLGDVQDLESLVDEAFREDSRIDWSQEGQQFRLSVALPDGRSQIVLVEPSEDAAADQILMITSVCCPVVNGYYEAALRLNSEIPFGSIAVRDIDGRSMFVVMDTYPRITVDVEAIRRSVLSVASRADAIEKLLTGVDRN